MRIASLVPSATEILFAVGVGDAVVARTHECDFPHEAARIPSVTSNLPQTDIPSADGRGSDAHTSYAIDKEALALAAPDLVVTESLCPGCAVDTAPVERCSLPAAVVSYGPANLAEVLASVGDIATAAGAGATGRAIVARLRSRLHWVTSLVADLEPPRVAVIEWPDPLSAPGRWVPEMVEAAGGINVFGTAGQPSSRVSVAELAATRPDVVVLAFRGYNLYETQARFKELIASPDFVEATRFARTFAVDGSAYFSRPGPRLIDGIELLAWALHRHHPRLQPPVGRGAKLIEAGWADIASLPLAATASA